MLLDLPGPMVRPPAAPSISTLVIFRFGATMELGRSGRPMMMPRRFGAARATGSASPRPDRNSSLGGRLRALVDLNDRALLCALSLTRGVPSLRFRRGSSRRSEGVVTLGEMIKSDRPIVRSSQHVCRSAILREPIGAARQRVRWNESLVAFHPRHMGVSEQCNTIGIERKRALRRRRDRGNGLIWQAVHFALFLRAGLVVGLPGFEPFLCAAMRLASAKNLGATYWTLICGFCPGWV